MDITRFTLPNGLRVVHHHDPQTAMVVLDVLYNTGARDESADRTGMAHLFEHLMFGGSVNIADFDGEIEAAGGSDNAFTSNDFTNFYDIVPAQNVETLFHLESDRMLSLAFSDRALDVQKGVVIEEFKQTCLNQPYGTAMHRLRSMLYSKHPYRWPVIGLTPEHIAGVTQDDVRRWFHAHYAPNNAILAICGNITADAARSLTEKWFGDIPARDIAPRMLVDDPWPPSGSEPLYLEVREQVPQTAVFMAYRMDPYGKPGYFAADAITDILSAGKSSRMQQRLVLGTDLFTMANAAISGSEHSGMLIVSGFLTGDSDDDVARAIEMLCHECEVLATPGDISDYELERSKNRFEATTTFENMSAVSLATNLAMAEYHGEGLADAITRYRALSTQLLAETAKRLFIDHRPAIVVFRPER